MNKTVKVKFATRFADLPTSHDLAENKHLFLTSRTGIYEQVTRY